MQDGKVRFEIERDDNHLVDEENGRIHEFKNDELSALIDKIVGEMGYDVVNFRVEAIGKNAAIQNAAVSKLAFIKKITKVCSELRASITMYFSEGCSKCAQSRRFDWHIRCL